MTREDAEKILYKVDMDGLDYALMNYANDIVDAEFQGLLFAYQHEAKQMNDYFERLREEFDIEPM